MEGLSEGKIVHLILQKFPQNERAELYHIHQSLKTSQSFVEFLQDGLRDRERFQEFSKKLETLK